MNEENYQSFSVRNGQKQPKPIQLEGMDRALQNGLWNAFFRCLADEKSDPYFPGPRSVNPMFRRIWIYFQKNPADEYTGQKSKQSVKAIIQNEDWCHVFDLIEFVIRAWPNPPSGLGKRYSNIPVDVFIGECNAVLGKENSAYRIIGDQIAKITSKEEVDSIEAALSVQFEGAREHIHQSLRLLFDRQNPDYRNSIKESISAVESIAKEFTGKEKSLTALTQELKLHANFKKGLDELYNWTSREFRHGTTDLPLHQDQNTARFMLVVCSAFVNYIISRNPQKHK